MNRLASPRTEGSPQHWTGRYSLPHNVFIWLLGLEIRFSRFQIIIFLTEPLPDPHQADHSSLEFLRQSGSGESGTKSCLKAHSFMHLESGHSLGLSLKVASPHDYSESKQKVWDGALWPSSDPLKILEPILADSIIRGLDINIP